MTLAAETYGTDLIGIYGPDEHAGFRALLVDVIAWAGSRGYLHDIVDVMVGDASRAVARLHLDEQAPDIRARQVPPL